MAVALEAFADFFKYNVPDLLILLGDRYEILSVAIAAAMQRIPILHIHGGEATFANYDEFIRHSITKMSSYHFTATEEYRRRVIQLGEQPENVFNLGALGAENCLCIDESEVSEEVRGLPAKGYLVILFHPETISGVSPGAQMVEILKALDALGDPLVVFLGTNADTGSDGIRLLVAQYVAEHSNARYFENLRTGSYHWLVKNSICLVGNSSSGLIEAPCLSAYTVNIGNRQAGRARGDSVVDVPCDMAEIIKAIQSVWDKQPVSPYSNPYYKQGAANEYFVRTKWVLRRLRDEGPIVKTFYDIPLVPEVEAIINE